MPLPPRSVELLAATLLVGGLAGTSDVQLAAAVPWPIGIVTGCVLWQRRPAHGFAVLAVALLGMTAGLALTGWGRDGVGVALAHIGGATVVVAMLTSAGRRRAALLTESDIGRYVGACLVGAAASAGGIALWYGLVEQRVAIDEMAAMVTTHVASQLVVVPFFLRRHAHMPLAGPVERIACWVVAALTTMFVFIAVQPPAVSFAVIAALSWGARRLGAWGGLIQMTAVAVFATMLTLEGLGPFDPAPARLDWTPDGPMLLVQFFIFCCALVVVPTLLTVGLEQVSLREASQERARIERIVSSADRVAIIGTDARGRITLFNPGAERLLGYRAEEVLSRSGVMFHSEDEIARQTSELGAPDDYDALVLALAQPEIAGREVRYLRKDGVVRTFLVNLSQVRDHEGHITGFVCIADDISDRVREQAALEEAVTRLRELDASKDTFVSSVSHELRTPLTSIVGYLELLADREYGDLTGPQRMALERISDNSDRLLSLIEDLLTFSRVGEEVQVEQVDLDLAEAVRSGCDVVEPLWRARRTHVTVRTPELPVCVTGDRALLERLVVNLVGNAVKFSPEEGHVDLTLRADDGWAELLVVDDGIGIPLDEQPMLFTRFFRSRVAMRGAVQGTGIGLSIVKAAVDAHQGTVEVESQERAGTTVRVRLPLTGTVTHPVVARRRGPSGGRVRCDGVRPCRRGIAGSSRCSSRWPPAGWRRCWPPPRAAARSASGRSAWPRSPCWRPDAGCGRSSSSSSSPSASSPSGAAVDRSTWESATPWASPSSRGSCGGSSPTAATSDRGSGRMPTCAGSSRPRSRAARSGRSPAR